LIRVPYYNSTDASSDPTHIHVFNECSFDYFDPGKVMGKAREYYSTAKFHIQLIGYRIYIFRTPLLICGSGETRDVIMPLPYHVKVVRSGLFKKLLPYLAHPLGNIIRTLHIELVRLP